jgi:hypothetical protein
MNPLDLNGSAHGWLCIEECSFSTGAVFDLSGERARPIRSSKRDLTKCTIAASGRKPKSKLGHTFSHFA